MPDNAINLQDKLALFTEHWSPRVIAEMNDYQFKLAKVQGEFVWHSHADTDEVFVVLRGENRQDSRRSGRHTPALCTSVKPAEQPMAVCGTARRR